MPKKLLHCASLNPLKHTIEQEVKEAYYLTLILQILEKIFPKKFEILFLYDDSSMVVEKLRGNNGSKWSAIGRSSFSKSLISS